MLPRDFKVKEQAPILVVEDNENDALLIRRTLTNACIPNPQHFVGTGEEAISYLVGVGPYSDRTKFPLPSLVLLDLKLPGMDGFEALKCIRANPLFEDLRIVVLTSSDRVRDVKEAYRLGANSFLMKPLEFEHARTLIDALGEHLWRQTSINRGRMPARVASTHGD